MLGDAFVSSKLGGHATPASPPLGHYPLTLCGFMAPELLMRLSLILYFRELFLFCSVKFFIVGEDFGPFGLVFEFLHTPR